MRKPVFGLSLYIYLAFCWRWDGKALCTWYRICAVAKQGPPFGREGQGSAELARFFATAEPLNAAEEGRLIRVRRRRRAPWRVLNAPLSATQAQYSLVPV